MDSKDCIYVKITPDNILTLRVLRLRALNSIGDWEAYWKWHKQKSYEREHAARYAEQTPPRPVYTGLYRHLKLVA